MRLAGRIQSIYEAHSKEVDFWWVYIQEAHPTDGRRPSRTVKVESHKTLDDRQEAAEGCSEASVLKVPILLDDMEDTAAKAYSAHPERFFILGTDGKIAYAGKRGPFGVDLDAMEARLKALLSEEKVEKQPKQKVEEKAKKE